MLTRSNSWSSNASLLSSVSTEYTTSGSSSSTIPGPGALTGKALKALGKATLRGFDRLVIAKHLATITHIFPHTDGQASRIKHISDIYDDLLEFSRPGMYNKETFEKALGFILTQISTGHTRHLIAALACWHVVELHILLSEILIQLVPLWNPSLRLVFSSPLFYSSYMQSQSSSSPSPIPLILFFSKLIRTGKRACQIALDVGFLDVLLSIYPNHTFHPPKLSKPDPLRDHLLIACNAALLDITGYLEYRSLVLHHPISSAWHEKINLVGILPFTTRQESLLLDTERDVVFDDESPYLRMSLMDICSEPCVSTMQADELLYSLTFELTHDQATRVYLTRSTHEEKVIFLSQLVDCMPKSITPAAEDTIMMDGFSWRYQLLFCLHFITVIAQTIPNGRRALADAGAINYLIHILQMEDPDSHFTVSISGVKPIDIPKVIREHKLVDFLDERGGTRLRCSIYRSLVTLFDDTTA